MCERGESSRSSVIVTVLGLDAECAVSILGRTWPVPRIIKAPNNAIEEITGFAFICEAALSNIFLRKLLHALAADTGDP